MVIMQFYIKYLYGLIFLLSTKYSFVEKKFFFAILNNLVPHKNFNNTKISNLHFTPMEKDALVIIRATRTVASEHRLLATMETGYELMVTTEEGHELIASVEVSYKVLKFV